MQVMGSIHLQSLRECIVRRAHDTIALSIYVQGDEVAVMMGKLRGHY